MSMIQSGILGLSAAAFHLMVSELLICCFLIVLKTSDPISN